MPPQMESICLKKSNEEIVGASMHSAQAATQLIEARGPLTDRLDLLIQMAYGVNVIHNSRHSALVKYNIETSCHLTDQAGFG